MYIQLENWINVDDGKHIEGVQLCFTESNLHPSNDALIYRNKLIIFILYLVKRLPLKVSPVTGILYEI